MAPPRRRAAATGQSTLSFGGRVTKPSTTPTTLHKAKNEPAKAKATSSTPDPVETSEPSAPVVTELVVRQQTKPTRTRKPTQTIEEKQALSLKLKDLRKYWGTKGRDSFRVHDKDTSLEEKILRNFDLTGQYGPCIGLSRLQRWQRAQRMGLNPPVEVLAVLLNGKDIADRAHMEELAQ